MSQTDRRTPIQERARATVDAIVEATARMLVEEGPERLSTNRIARRAGVSVGTLYQYFPDKDSILREVGKRTLESQLEAFEAGLAGLMTPDIDLEQAVRTLILGVLHTKALNPELSRVLLRTGAVGGEDWNQRWLERLRELVRSGLHVHRAQVRPGDLDVMTYVIVTGFEFVLQDALKHRPHLVRDGRLADEVAELAVRYLRVDRS